MFNRRFSDDLLMSSNCLIEVLQCSCFFERKSEGDSQILEAECWVLMIFFDAGECLGSCQNSASISFIDFVLLNRHLRHSPRQLRMFRRLGYSAVVAFNACRHLEMAISRSSKDPVRSNRWHRMIAVVCRNSPLALSGSIFSAKSSMASVCARS